VDFFDFIDKKPLFYKKIDLKRVEFAYGLLKSFISKPRAIHIIGTNGKGSIGRTIAHLAHKAGLKVGHYSSPHIVKFNERIWINGSEVDDVSINLFHKRVYKILGYKISNSLSYFEYTTLLALVAFEHLDLIVLEAGLGGEFDATTVVENRVLSVITPIGLDHQDFLGDTISEITITKLKSITQKALLAPQIYDEVENIAQQLSQERGFQLHIADRLRIEDVETILKSYRKVYPRFLVSNMAVATQALDVMEIDYSIDDLKSLKLFGRFNQIAQNVIIDVGHNVLSAKAVFEAIDSGVILIYNTLSDKDYRTILSILKPKIYRVEIIEINSDRAVEPNRLEATLKELKIAFRKFNGTLNKSNKYLVFGSFYTVEAFFRCCSGCNSELNLFSNTSSQKV
jgi:dihydrofolate synthase/folylpolyglutamate synthase